MTAKGWVAIGEVFEGVLGSRGRGSAVDMKIGMWDSWGKSEQKLLGLGKQGGHTLTEIRALLPILLHLFNTLECVSQTVSIEELIVTFTGSLILVVHEPLLQAAESELFA
jgi:hypothetical protein